jgi:hypothetical protein
MGQWPAARLGNFGRVPAAEACYFFVMFRVFRGSLFQLTDDLGDRQGPACFKYSHAG